MKIYSFEKTMVLKSSTSRRNKVMKPLQFSISKENLNASKERIMSFRRNKVPNLGLRIRPKLALNLSEIQGLAFQMQNKKKANKIMTKFLKLAKLRSLSPRSSPINHKKEVRLIL